MRGAVTSIARSVPNGRMAILKSEMLIAMTAALLVRPLTIGGESAIRPLPVPPATTAIERNAVSKVPNPISRGLWWLYQPRYAEARASFDAYIRAHPRDPEGYFYRTAVDWWQIAQNYELNQPELERRLHDDYQTTVRIAGDLRAHGHDRRTEARSYLYEGGAEGLWGRWLVTRGEWVKAYHAGKSGAQHLRRALALNPSLYDADLGLGIYDYYTDTLSGVQRVLSKLLIHGNRRRGLRELRTALDRGQHSRVEAMLFLIEIYSSHEHQPMKALAIARQLHSDFPQSPAMHLAEIQALYDAHQWATLAVASQRFMDRCERNEPYYSNAGIPEGRYYRGLADLWGQRRVNSCIALMTSVIATAAPASRWATFAHLRRGQAYDVERRRSDAMADYRIVLSRPDVWGSQAEANAYLHTPFSLSRKEASHSAARTWLDSPLPFAGVQETIHPSVDAEGFAARDKPLAPPRRSA